MAISMQFQINKLTSEVAALTATQQANHAENRKDIHKLFNGQQALVDSVTSGLDKIADKIGTRISVVEKEVAGLNLRLAKAFGYVMGASAAGAIVFELVKFIMAKAVDQR